MVGRGEDAQKLLCVSSKNSISLSWPYKTTPARFCISGDQESLSAGRYDAFIQLFGDGQILPDEGFTVTVDDRPPLYIKGIRTDDGSADTAFLYDDMKVVRLLNTAHTLKIKATYYQNGSQTAVFDVSKIPVHVFGLTTIEIMDRDDELKFADTPEKKKEVTRKYDCINEGGANCGQIMIYDYSIQALKPAPEE
ncbi:MAG: hypothetical protein ACTHLA_10115 [Asticcacaulis sp.]|uniref:hypothetical protein n=1 Tax=Asticcacaulis sp. TaxID=1872648 RepID=UPI003F7C0DA5